ncbi:MAG: hypothetical protein DWQ31_08615 [Planctomycetota bacterium]|nr:MAG: hypothetical protein DWQ31_08615 [Planctomycetota bacterium]REJ86944.1 MAG: hypothetical protein DWQ35_22555 [Planctomycetota bacterium]REK24929.1 MAG: hypothetical protein DWQ42_12615 [Planctomycetota bacterium]REK48518.1 MAG: hypothetical protein DWQ46_02145 [Planctomycetota bacterium]
MVAELTAACMTDWLKNIRRLLLLLLAAAMAILFILGCAVHLGVSLLWFTHTCPTCGFPPHLLLWLAQIPTKTFSTGLDVASDRRRPSLHTAQSWLLACSRAFQ